MSRYTIDLKNVIASFPHVIVARAMQGEPPESARYSLSCVLDAVEHAASLKEIAKHYQDIVKADFNGRNPSKPLPLRKGEEKYPDDARFQGKYILNSSAKRNRRPKVVDNMLNPITEDGIIYGGCLVNVSLNMYSYRPAGGGITFGLEGVQFAGHGEPFEGGGRKVDEMFNTVDVEGDPGSDPVYAAIAENIDEPRDIDDLI